MTTGTRKYYDMEDDGKGGWILTSDPNPPDYKKTAKIMLAVSIATFLIGVLATVTGFPLGSLFGGFISGFMLMLSLMIYNKKI